MDVEVAELVGGLVGRDDVEVVTELLLLEVLLGEVLEVALGERGLGNDVEAVLVAGDDDGVTEDTGLAVDLDAVVEELLERSLEDIEEMV